MPAPQGLMRPCVQKSATKSSPQAQVQRKQPLPQGVVWTLSIYNPNQKELEQIRDGLIAVIVVASLALGCEWAHVYGVGA